MRLPAKPDFCFFLSFFFSRRLLPIIIHFTVHTMKFSPSPSLSLVLKKKSKDLFLLVSCSFIDTNHNNHHLVETQKSFKSPRPSLCNYALSTLLQSQLFKGFFTFIFRHKHTQTRLLLTLIMAADTDYYRESFHQQIHHPCCSL